MDLPPLHLLVIPLLLFCCFLNASDGVPVITTLRKSQNREGFICLLVSRDRNLPYPATPNRFNGRPTDTQRRRNAKRGFRFPNGDLQITAKLQSPPVTNPSSGFRHNYLQSQTYSQSVNNEHTNNSFEIENVFLDSTASTLLSPNSMAASLSILPELTSQSAVKEPETTSQFAQSQPNTGEETRRYSLLQPSRSRRTGRIVYRRPPTLQVSLWVQNIHHGNLYTVGNVSVNASWLTEGKHTLYFRHIIENYQHELRVEVDGRVCAFHSLKVRSYWDDAYRFNEVRIKLKGPVRFTANRSCEDDTEYSPPVVPVLDEPKADRDEQKEEDTIPSFSRDNPESVLSNRNLTGQVIQHKILINTNVEASQIESSYIYNSTISDSNLIKTILFNTTIFNSTLDDTVLHNVTLINSSINNSTTFRTVFHNSSGLNTVVHNSTTHILGAIINTETTSDILQQDIGLAEDWVVPDNRFRVNAINISLLVFGSLGLVAVFSVIIVTSVYAIRRSIHKRQEMLIVRRAVMGDLQSW